MPLNNQQDMKAILFCRVSSKEQEETGYSLDDQKKILEQYANSKGFETARIFRVSESASGKQVRKLFNEMLSVARKEKIEIICCEKIDRLTRNPKDAGTIDDWIKEAAVPDLQSGSIEYWDLQSA